MRFHIQLKLLITLDLFSMHAIEVKAIHPGSRVWRREKEGK